MQLLDALEQVSSSWIASLPPDGWLPLTSITGTQRQMRALLADNDAVTNKVAGQAYVENFALQVFNRADDEDRAGRATKCVQHRSLDWTRWR